MNADGTAKGRCSVPATGLILNTTKASRERRTPLAIRAMDVRPSCRPALRAGQGKADDRPAHYEPARSKAEAQQQDGTDAGEEQGGGVDDGGAAELPGDGGHQRQRA